MTHLFINTDFIVKRAIASRRKKMREHDRAPNVHLILKKAKCEEKEKQHLSAQTTPWEDLVSFMDALQLQEFPYGKQGLADGYRIPLTNSAGFYAHGLDEWGFPIPKHSRDPRSPKNFESHTQKFQAELPLPILSHGLLYATNAASGWPRKESYFPTFKLTLWCALKW